MRKPSVGIVGHPLNGDGRVRQRLFVPAERCQDSAAPQQRVRMIGTLRERTRVTAECLVEAVRFGKSEACVAQRVERLRTDGKRA